MNSHVYLSKLIVTMYNVRELKCAQSVEPITDLKAFVTLLNLQKILWELYVVLMDCSLVNLCWSKVVLSSSIHIVTYIISSECKIKIIVKCVMSMFVMLELIPWTRGYREVSLASWSVFFFPMGLLVFFIYFVQHVHFINKCKCNARAVLNTRKTPARRDFGQNTFD